jgi:NAD(P)-dependent dehydrogenase (short-subunit alcohol dehydrogenase family)
MAVALVDLGEGTLKEAAAQVAAAGAAAVTVPEIDVRDRAALDALAAEVEPEVLMANAGIGPASECFGPAAAWEALLGVNLWGVIHTVQAFGPGMVARGRAGAVICTGSKQGITTPPGNPAYNISKAGV